MKPARATSRHDGHTGHGGRIRLRFWRRMMFGTMLTLVLAACAALYALDKTGITPRSLGPYIERRSDGHNAVIEAIGETVRMWLIAADRGELLPATLGPADNIGSIGARHAASGPVATMPEAGVTVSDTPGLIQAMATALPGQTIILQPGRYRIDRPLEASRSGKDDAPIVVRAQVPGQTRIEIATREGIRVSAPYWIFRDLTLRGICAKANYCEHAFHVVGKGHHFSALNNLVLDFDAHFKINGERGAFPDHGLIASNTLSNTTIRMTTRPVTPIDLVAASHWKVRKNLISDFVKGDGDRISYGGFAKGGGSNNIFEQNVVLCEDQFRGAAGQRIGLSLGGGSTGPAYCRDGRCITEQNDSVLRANLIASCSDDGIYLNAAARSKIVHNTLVDTGGVTVRFPESSADIDGNLVDGMIRSRDGGLLRMAENRHTSVVRLYAGSHPYRSLFMDPRARDFRWRDPADHRTGQLSDVPDLCGVQRPRLPRFGAFEDFAACLSGR